MPLARHLCVLYQDQDGRRQVTAAVVRAALAAGDQVMYVGPRPPDVALALLEAGGIETGRPLRGGQLLVHSRSARRLPGPGPARHPPSRALAGPPGL